MTHGSHASVAMVVTDVLPRLLQMYEQEHGKKMKTSSIAAMLATMLYQKRFFPFYVHNILAGIDDEGITFYSIYSIPYRHRHTYCTSS